MGRSQETSNKKEVRSKQDKKRKDKEKKRIFKKENDNGGGSMIAYVDEFGMISSTPPDFDRRKNTNAEDIEISIPKRDASQKSNPIRKGILTFFNDSKGFGFIRDLETQDSVFVHVNNFQEQIQQDNVVSFEVENGQRGPAAVNVRIFRAEVVVPPVKAAATTEPAAPTDPTTPV